jgi:hypothetical protein
MLELLMTLLASLIQGEANKTGGGTIVIGG